MTDQEQIAALKTIIRDTLWMAQRYANGRLTYAVAMYNAAARTALGLNVFGDESDFPPWARDGMGDAFSGLTKSEIEEAGMNDSCSE